MEKSRQVKHEIENELAHEIHSVARKYSDNKIGIHRTPYIEIRTQNELPVPENIEGTPIKITEDIPELRPECDDSTSTCLPGGTSISPSRWGTILGTLGVSIHYKYYSIDIKGFLTSAHVASTDHCSHIENETVYDGEINGDVVGTVKRWSWIQDYAVLKVDGDYDPKSSLVNEAPIVWGYVTKDGIEDMASTNETVRKFGQTTCMTEGNVLGIGDEDDLCGGTRFEAVRLNYSSDSGDSGGPVYTIRQSHDWTWISILGVHFGHDGQGTRLASPCYKLSHAIEEIGVHGC